MPNCCGWLRGPGRDLDERFEATLLLHQRPGATRPRTATRSSSKPSSVSGPATRCRCPDLRRQLRVVGRGQDVHVRPGEDPRPGPATTALPASAAARGRTHRLGRALRRGGADRPLLAPATGTSYAELARWLDGDAGGSGDHDVREPLVAVAAMTDDFETAVLLGKKDREALPARLRDKETAEYAEVAALAETRCAHRAGPVDTGATRRGGAGRCVPHPA